jgi:integrase
LFCFLFRSGSHATVPKLQDLIDGVPQLIYAGRAQSTKKKYESAWTKWVEFCSDVADINPTPATPFDIAVYFNYLLTTRGTRGCITDAMYGIRWGHSRSGLLPPTDHPFVKLAYDGAIRLSNFEGTNKKEPFTASMLHTLIDLDHLDNRIFFRFVIICLLGFTGFMRLDELLNLKVGEIHFYDSHMTLTIPKCKNDQSWEGNIIHLS